MDFDWTGEQRVGRERIAALLDAVECARLAAAEGAELASLREARLRGQRRLAEGGAWRAGPEAREDARALERVAADLELARTSTSFFLSTLATRHFAALLADHGSAALRGELLEPLRRGERVGAVALPASGGVVDGTPVATPGTDGGWTLRGRRPYLTNGSLADGLAVFAEFDGRSLLALLRPDQPGLRLGARLSLLGLDGLAACSLELDEVRVPAGQVAGPFDDPGPAAWCRRDRDLGLAVAGVGLMQRAFAAAKAHAGEHVRGGKPIVARQEVSFKLAEMLTLAQTAEYLVCRAAWMVATGRAEAETLVRCAKVFCTENAERVASAALQVFAGRGCVSGNEVERAWREAKTVALLGTTVEVARMAIADELLARP